MDDAEPALDVAHRILGQWAEAFVAQDVGAMSELYADDVLFFGSTPELITGRAGVRRYFSALPPVDGVTIDFRDVQAISAPGHINIASVCEANFQGGSKVRTRMSHAVTFRDGGWKISAHHASPAEPLRS